MICFFLIPLCFMLVNPMPFQSPQLFRVRSPVAARSCFAPAAASQPAAVSRPQTLRSPQLFRARSPVAARNRVATSSPQPLRNRSFL